LRDEVAELGREVELNSDQLAKKAMGGSLTPPEGSGPSEPPDLRQPPLPADLLPVIGQVAKESPAVEPRCGSCRHFDKELFDREMAGNAIFREVMRHRSPNELVESPGEPSEDGSSRAAKGPLSLRENQWECFGLCILDGIALHETDKCDRFEP
jgi:hypothetical protein